MDVEFARTGERRYAVTVRRQDDSVLQMSPAAGFDPLIPHDLVHLVVESELGLRLGVFGQIAAGGTAGTFHELRPDTGDRRETARRRRRQAQRGEALLRAGRSDAERSERAAAACLRFWMERRAARGRRPGPGAQRRGPGGSLGREAARAEAGVTEEQLRRICEHFDRLSDIWAGLAVGEALTVGWPLRDPAADEGATCHVDWGSTLEAG
jgi:hypothetical protein